MAKILVVEDEIIVAWDIKETLEKLGHTVVDLVVSGSEALAAAADDRPDLVLMDIRLEGEMDGIAAGGELYHQFNIPVVYLTAHADELTLARATKTDPFGYVTKPFQLQSLQSTIKVALQRHQVETASRQRQANLADTLKSIGSGIITTDRQGLVTFLNPIAEYLTGWHSEAAIGQDIGRVFRLIWETDGTEIENPSARAMRLKQSITSSERCWLVAKDGIEIPIADTATPIFQPNGEIVGSIVIFKDNTLQLSAEMDLWERNQDLEFFQIELVAQLEVKTAEYRQAIACMQVLDLVLDRIHTVKTERELLQLALAQFSMEIDADYTWIALHDSQAATATISGEYINRERLHPASKIDKEIDMLRSPQFYERLFAGNSWVAPSVEILPQLYLDLLTPTTQIAIFPIAIDDSADRRFPQLNSIAGEVGILTTGKPLWTTAKTSPISQLLSFAIKLFRQARTKSIVPGESQIDNASAISISSDWLDNLKDDFLSAIAEAHQDLSVNIQMFQQQIQSLERETEDLAIVLHDRAIHRELDINLASLQSEWQRQLQLIDIFIDIRANGTVAQMQSFSDLLFCKWAVDIAKNCGSIATRSKLNFSERIPNLLPPILFCPFPAIAPIVIELFYHACKYTPLDCPIILDIDLRSDRLAVSIISLEIEIPIWELETIFCCFTKNTPDLSLPADRPNLGLALVQKLLLELGGKIEAASDRVSTRIILSIPILQPDRSS